MLRQFRQLSTALPAVTAILGLLLGAGVHAEELVAYQIAGGERIEAPLTGQAGDPARGREIAIPSRSAAVSGPTIRPEVGRVTVLSGESA